MRLTPFAKFFVTIVILVVVGYAVYHYKGADVRKWATGGEKGSKASSSDNVSASDFNALKNAPPDPSRDAGSNGVSAVSLASGGKLNPTLVVAINTWAGRSETHTPE